uniref:Uncharacterized protein n=1 Tax=Arion vulgaris TaxID=1028688 RepID=A0A0B7BIB0_9EUPU
MNLARAGAFQPALLDVEMPRVLLRVQIEHRMYILSSVSGRTRNLISHTVRSEISGKISQWLYEEANRLPFGTRG